MKLAPAPILLLVALIGCQAPATMSPTATPHEYGDAPKPTVAEVAQLLAYETTSALDEEPQCFELMTSEGTSLFQGEDKGLHSPLLWCYAEQVRLVHAAKEARRDLLNAHNGGFDPTLLSATISALDRFASVGLEGACRPGYVVPLDTPDCRERWQEHTDRMSELKDVLNLWTEKR